MHKIHYSVVTHSPREKVYETMLADASKEICKR